MCVILGDLLLLYIPLIFKIEDINTFLWKWAPDFQEVMGGKTWIIEVSETKGRQWLFSEELQEE